ncbi:4880_t:CDS:2 [Acaulospora morrowiae]|uniref:tRNA pseudouridine(55) synthase n=1 Tax=Acaulospora morrowiae TaxID=94023 RepID=A0A9N8VJQ6_9GLOM|nr:4880_t:CDS:2 [Acaulospora morrowiae]
MKGLFAINKPRGKTSADLLNTLKKALGKKPGVSRSNIKLGHGGTLDPLATGVLVVGVNGGCKELSKYLKCNKVYSSVGLLGYSTDTYDSEGQVIGTGPTSHITKEMLVKLLPQFTGEIMQIPPLYSALKMNGQRLCDYARKGIEPPKKIEARKVKIHSLSLLNFTTKHNYRPPERDFHETEREASLNFPVFKIQIECGGGTYIRSLVHDIGRGLNSEAHVVELERLQQGDFKLGVNTIEWNDCLNVDSITEALEKYNQTLFNEKS